MTASGRRAPLLLDCQDMLPSSEVVSYVRTSRSYQNWSHGLIMRVM